MVVNKHKVIKACTKKESETKKKLRCILIYLVWLLRQTKGHAQ